MNLYRALRRGTVFKALMGREPFHWVRPRPAVQEFGSRYGRWAVDTSALGPDTTLVTFGLGGDVTFELALIQRFGCAVWGFDPTPASVDYIARQVNEPRLRTAALAVADHDGTMQFQPPPPDAADQFSASAVAHYQPDHGGAIEVPCLTLESVRRRLNIGRIDLLKMDIEGAEYAVLKQAVAQGWLQGVQQLLVEFHHFLPGLSAQDTRSAIATLQAQGFDIAWVGRTNHEYLFLRRP